MYELKEIIRKIWQPLLIAGLILICFQNCNDNKSAVSENKSLENNVKSEQSKADKYFYDFKKKETEFIELEKKYNLSKLESKAKIKTLAEAQTKEVKPKYIENIANCNDTVAKVYNYSKYKDSLANVVIFSLNKNILDADCLIETKKVEQDLLLSTILSRTNAMNDLEKINMNNKDLIRKKNNENWFWKSTTAGALIVIGKLILFK